MPEVMDDASSLAVWSKVKSQKLDQRAVHICMDQVSCREGLVASALAFWSTVLVLCRYSGQTWLLAMPRGSQIFNERHIAHLIWAYLDSYDVFLCFWTLSVEIAQGMSKLFVATRKEEVRRNRETRTAHLPPPKKKIKSQNKFLGDTD